MFLSSPTDPWRSSPQLASQENHEAASERKAPCLDTANTGTQVVFQSSCLSSEHHVRNLHILHAAFFKLEVCVCVCVCLRSRLGCS